MLSPLTQHRHPLFHPMWSCTHLTVVGTAHLLSQWIHGVYMHILYILYLVCIFFIINKYVNRYIQWKYFQETTFSSYHNSFMRVLSFSCYKELQNIVHTHTQWPALAIPNFFSFSYLMSMDLASQMWNCLLKVLAKFKFGYILKNCLLNSFTI